MISLPANDASPREVAQSYWAAEIERNVEKVMAHYHRNAVFVPNGQVLVGHDQIRTFYDESCRRFPILEVEIVRDLRLDRQGVIEWSAALTDYSGRRMAFVGVNIVEIEAGRFREVRAYFDTSTLS